MKDSKLNDLSMSLAIDVIRLCDGLAGHYSLVNQVERSVTSIGANIRESNYAQSKTDFVYKLQLALKEANETEYWLELFYKSGIADEAAVKRILHSCGVVRKLLITSINTAKADKPPIK